MPIMTSRLVLSLKEVADKSENMNERNLTVMSFSARFSPQESDPELDALAYVDDRALPLRIRLETVDLDPGVE